MEGEKKGRECHPLLRRSRSGDDGYQHGLSHAQLRSLAAVCEALLPPLEVEDVAVHGSREEPPSKSLQAFYRTSGADAQLPEEVGEFFGKGMPEAVSLLRVVMWLLSTRLGTLVLCGLLSISWRFPFLHKFPDLPLEKREQVLQRWSRETFLRPLRVAFVLLKVITFYVFFTKVWPSSAPLLPTDAINTPRQWQLRGETQAQQVSNLNGKVLLGKHALPRWTLHGLEYISDDPIPTAYSTPCPTAHTTAGLRLRTPSPSAPPRHANRMRCSKFGCVLSPATSHCRCCTTLTAATSCCMPGV